MKEERKKVENQPTKLEKKITHVKIVHPVKKRDEKKKY